MSSVRYYFCSCVRYSNNFTLSSTSIGIQIRNIFNFRCCFLTLNPYMNALLQHAFWENFGKTVDAWVEQRFAVISLPHSLVLYRTHHQVRHSIIYFSHVQIRLRYRWLLLRLDEPRLISQVDLESFPFQPSRDLDNTLQWRHNEHDGVSNHRHFDCLSNFLFRRRSK